MADTHPEAQTLSRSRTVCDLIKHTFAVIYNHLSQLGGRPIKQFARDTNLPFIHKWLTNDDKRIVASSVSVETYDAHLLHKLLKICCGLKPPNDEAWKSEEADTLESFITYCWTEYRVLREGSEMTDSDLNYHMDKVLEALILTIEKVEEKKGVDESALKSELTRHIGEKEAFYNDSPICHHRYAILSQHSVHVMLIIVYQELNNLKGVTLEQFLTRRRINVTPTTLYSNEHKFLKQNPPPEHMSISILYKVLKRVCFGFNPSRHSRQSKSVLEQKLSNLKQEYNTPPASEMEYKEKSSKIYTLLRDALTEVMNQKQGKSLRQIIQNLPREPYFPESFRKPFKIPTCFMQPLPTTPKHHSPMESSDIPTKCPVSSPSAPSPAMVTASSHGSLKQEEINVAVLFKVLCPGGVAVKTLALVFEALKGNVQSVTSKGKAYKDTFTKDEKKLIASQDFTDINNLAKMDVTFVCKLLRTGCASLSNKDDVWTRQGNTLEYFITSIRKERNKLSHDISTLKTNELCCTLQNIEVYQKTILEMTELRLGKNENDMKKKLREHKDMVESDIQKIITCVPHNSYYWTIEKMRKEMTSEIIAEAGTELQKMHLYRENLHYMSPLSGCDDTQQFLTTKDVYVDRELEDTSDIEAVAPYRIKDILFGQDDGFASSRVIVIHGRPGGGNTSLCKHAYHLWSTNLAESSQNGVDLLIYISCRFVTTKSISAYLKERLPKTFKNIDKDDIIPLMQEPRVVFVVDGYGEAGGEAKSLIDDILTSMPDCRMIITTKTQYLPKITKRVKSVTLCYKILRIMEVTEDMRQEVIKKIFNAVGKDTKCCDKFLGYLNEVKQKIYALICCPLTFCLLSLLWIKKPDIAKEIQTLPQLYHKLNDLILQRVSKKIAKDKFYCSEWMTKLGKIAWENLKENQHFLDNEDLDTLKRKALELNLTVEESNCILSSLIQCDEVHDSHDDDAKNWNFMLSSQQEYFAAEYIVDSLKNENSSLTEILELEETNEEYKKKVQRLVPVIEFVCGLLAIHKGLTKERVSEITKIMSITEPWAFTAMTNMLKPLLQKSGVERIVKTVFKNQEMSTFENYDPQSILWVMKHTSLSVPKQVNFINTMSELTHVEPLLQHLKSKSYSVKVTVDANKLSNISDLDKLTGDIRHNDIVFTFMPWKPMCIAKLVQDWPRPTPLRLTLLPEVLHLVWWELLICLLSPSCKVTKIVYSSQPESRFGGLVEDGSKWLNAETATDSTLAPTELLIYCV